MGWVKSATLKQLRERMALDPESVEQEARKLPRGQYARVAARQIRDWEINRSAPDLEQLETLAEIYAVPVGYFFLDEAPKAEAPLSFRGLSPGKQDRLSHDTRRTVARFLELAEWLTGLIQDAGLPWDVQVEPRSSALSDLATTIKTQRQGLGRQADQAVSSWKNPDDAFVWWRHRIESLGVFCIQMKLGTQDIRGASIWVRSGDAAYPFILVNHENSETATGRLFTLLHEYGHLLTGGKMGGIACDFHGSDRGRREEPLANRFASNLLLPRAAFRHYLDTCGLAALRAKWTDTELDKLRKPFFVSRDVVAIALEELEFAPKGFYQQRRTHWDRVYAGRRAWGRGKSLTKNERAARQLGTAGVRVLLRANQHGRLPVLDAASALDMKVERVSEFLEWSRQNAGNGHPTR